MAWSSWQATLENNMKAYTTLWCTYLITSSYFCGFLWNKKESSNWAYTSKLWVHDASGVPLWFVGSFITFISTYIRIRHTWHNIDSGSWCACTKRKAIICTNEWLNNTICIIAHLSNCWMGYLYNPKLYLYI